MPPGPGWMDGCIWWCWAIGLPCMPPGMPVSTRKRAASQQRRHIQPGAQFQLVRCSPPPSTREHQLVRLHALSPPSLPLSLPPSLSLVSIPPASVPACMHAAYVHGARAVCQRRTAPRTRGLPRVPCLLSALTNTARCCKVLPPHRLFVLVHDALGLRERVVQVVVLAR